MKLLLQILEHEEGWRGRPYYCSEGYPTVGYGFKIGDKGAPLPDFRLPKSAGDEWLVDLCDELECQMVLDLLPVNNAGRRAVLLSMAYQMGAEGVKKFRKMWEAVSAKDWDLAADEMLDSKWARQTPERADRHARIMRGEDPAGIYL